MDIHSSDFNRDYFQSFYYAYSILGMELFKGAVNILYEKQNQTNST